jgi:hypothetical protein
VAYTTPKKLIVAPDSFLITTVTVPADEQYADIIRAKPGLGLALSDANAGTPNAAFATETVTACCVLFNNVRLWAELTPVAVLNGAVCVPREPNVMLAPDFRDTPLVVMVVPVSRSEDARNVGDVIVVPVLIAQRELGQLMYSAVPVIPALDIVPPCVVDIAPIATGSMSI